MSHVRSAMDNIVQNSSTPKKIVIILCKIGRKQGGARFPRGKHHFNMTKHCLLAQSLLTKNAAFFTILEQCLELENLKTFKE